MKLFKQLDKLVTKSFVGPYLVAFLVAEFVLVLQFIWRYIDEFIGRGVSVFVIAEMIFYYGITIIPLAVPISILISSVMVYGNLAERYELTSFKSAGVGLYRIMRPGLVIAILTAFFSIFASNYLKPRANLSFYQGFDNIRRAKPTLTIDQGIFNYDFKGFAIRVGKKHSDGKGIEDVLIYDQTDRRLLGVITAKEGDMYISDDGQFFTMELRNGVQYSEMERKDKTGRRDQDQFMRIYFEKYVKNFDMSAFEFSMGSANMGRRKHDLYNSFQMQVAIDSIENKIKDDYENNRNNYGELIKGLTPDETEEDDPLADDGNAAKKRIDPEKKLSFYQKDSIQASKYRSPVPDQAKNNKLKTKTAPKFSTRNSRSADRYYNDRVDFRKDEYALDTMKSLFQTIRSKHIKTLLFRAKSSAQTLKEKQRNLVSQTKSSMYNRNRFELRLHQQLCWAFICIIFLFIGAPLGSIVRKGGFGYPLLVAIVFFVIFIFTNILGEKLMSNGTLNPIIGAWLPCIILAPISFYFTWKAIRDSKFNLNIKSWFGL